MGGRPSKILRRVWVLYLMGIDGPMLALRVYLAWAGTEVNFVLAAKNIACAFYEASNFFGCPSLAHAVEQVLLNLPNAKTIEMEASAQAGLKVRGQREELARAVSFLKHAAAGELGAAVDLRRSSSETIELG